MRPVLLVIAGPNGSGKTTVTERLRADHWSEGVEYLNPDEIAQARFGGWNDPLAVRDAANWTERRREELLAAHLGIAFETVFSTAGKVDFVSRAVRDGYFVRLFFVGTTTPEINAARVAQRVMRGGHDVSIPKIIARYTRAMANLAVALPLVQRAYIFDNSIDGADARLCARCVDGQVRKVYGPQPTWIEDAISEVPPHHDFEDHRG